MKNLTFRVAYTENDATSDIEICALACKGYKDEQGNHKTVLLGDRWCVYPGNEKTPDYHMSYRNASRNASRATGEQAVSEKVISIELKHACEDVTEILLLAYVSKRNKKAGNIYDAYADGAITLSDTNADDETIADISLSNGRLANEVTIHIGTLFRKPQQKPVEAGTVAILPTSTETSKKDEVDKSFSVYKDAMANKEAKKKMADSRFTSSVFLNDNGTVTATVTENDSSNVSVLNKVLDTPEKENIVNAHKALSQSNQFDTVEGNEVFPSLEWDLAIFRRGSSTISIPEIIKSLGGEVEYL